MALGAFSLIRNTPSSRKRPSHQFAPAAVWCSSIMRYAMSIAWPCTAPLTCERPRWGRSEVLGTTRVDGPSLAHVLCRKQPSIVCTGGTTGVPDARKTVSTIIQLGAALAVEEQDPLASSRCFLSSRLA
jgi:hypothetical protein